MSERDEYIEIEVITRARVRYTPAEYGAFLLQMREHSDDVVTVQTVDQSGNGILFELPPALPDPDVVSKSDLQHFHKRHVADDTPNTLSSSAWTKLLKGIDPDHFIFDPKKHVVGVKSEAFEARCEAVLRGDDKDVTGPKTLGLIRGYLTHRESLLSKNN